MWINWKVVRFVAGLFGIGIFCAVVMSAGVVSQLGGSGLSETPPQSDSSTSDTSTSSTDDESQTDDGGQAQGEGSFWDNVGAAEIVKAQIDNAARDKDCATLDGLRQSWEAGGIVLAGGVDAETEGPETTRAVLGYLANQTITAGCETD
jgi:hypothetical protein